MEWPPVDEKTRLANADLQEATEFGGCGIAILVLREISGLVVVERSRKGLGFDYRLDNQDDDRLFQGKARLEVSGLLTGSKAHIDARMRRKKARMGPGNHRAPGYAAIVKFGTPIAYVDKT